MLPFDQFLEAWNQPAMRHAMVGHFPIVLSVIGLPFVILAAMWGRRVTSLRWIAVATYLLLVISAYVTRNAGDAAYDAIAGSLSDEAHELLEEHEDLGDNVWLLALIPTVLLGLSFVPKPKVRHPAAILERWSAEELKALGLVPVVEDPRPAIDETAQALEPVPAKKGDTAPRDRWRVVDLAPAEHLARVRAVRRGKNPEIGDQLDAILTQLQAMAAAGTALEPGMTAIIAAVAQVKADWPLPSEAPSGA